MTRLDPISPHYDAASSEQAGAHVHERQLIDGVRRGDRAAFEAMYRAYYSPLVGFLYPYLGSEALAEEQVQELFLAIWRLREQWDVRTTLRAYLYRSARNRALNYLKHARIEEGAASALPAGEPSFGMGTAPPASDDTIVADDLAEAARRAIERLPRRCRTTFQLSRDHGLTYAEVAQAMGVSEHTVKIQMTRALKAIRHALTPWLA